MRNQKTSKKKIRRQLRKQRQEERVGWKVIERMSGEPYFEEGTRIEEAKRKILIKPRFSPR